MRFSLFLMVGLLCCCWGATPAMAQPVNDNCADAALFEVFVGPNAYTNVGATTDGSQTFCFFSNDVWFTFTPANTNSYIINTCGSSYDTEIQVFDGTFCPDTGNGSIACNDDSCGLQSSVTVAMTGGVTYMIRAGSFSAATTGAATLTITELVSAGNDECVGATPAVLGFNTLDTTGATTSADPYDDLTCTGTVLGAMTRDVWYTYTPAGTTLQVSTCNIAGDTDIVVYQGGACGALTQVGCNGDGVGCATFSSNAIVTVAPGIQCIIRIGSWSAAGPAQVGQFLVNETAPEDCTNGIDDDLDGLTDCADTADCIPGVAPCIEVCNDGIDNDADGLTDCADSIECGADPFCDESVNCADAIDNDIDGFTDCDDVDCAGAPACVAPSSDFCLGATPIVEGVGFAFDTTLATPSSAFSCALGQPEADVWFAYTSSCDGQATITTTSGPGNDTIVEVFDACGGNVIGCDDDSAPTGCCLSQLSFPTVSGTTYLVRVSGWAGGFGPGTFDVSCINGGPEDCSDGIDNDLDGLTDCADAIDCGALPQCIEAGNCGDAIDNDADGLTDCADSIDCPLGIAPCIPPVNDDCLSALPLTCGVAVFGDTVLASPDVAPLCGTTDGTGGGIWYTLLGNGDQVILNTCQPGTTYDTKIRVYSDCPATTCVVGNDDITCTPIFRSEVQWLTTPGVTYYVLVHGFGAAEGLFEMAVTCVTPGVENCSDALDNDLDGLIDCADDVDCPDGVAPCIEDCTDLVDNDADGFLDCLDPDCAGFPACVEVCTDGIDNDTDGFIDCADSECACTAACPAPIAGDECCTSLAVTAGANAFSTVGMTTSSDAYNPGQCAGTAFGSNSNDVWLSYVATSNGIAFWDTCQAGSFDTDVTIYEGADCATKVQIACNGDGTGLAGCQIFYSAGTFPVIAGETYQIRIGAYGVGASGSGTLTINENCGTPVTNLVGSGDCVTGDVTLGWDATAAFSSFDITRDAVSIATGLPGGSTSYVDTSATSGAHLYEVIGVCAGGGTATADVNVTLAAYGGEQDLVVRGELPSQIDSVAALTAELTALGRTFLVIDGGIGAYPCNNAPFEIIWQMNGTWPDYRCINAADAAALVAAHAAGTSIYTECGDQWGFCAQGTTFVDIDAVGSAADGNDTFLGMDGLDSALGLDVSDMANVVYSQDQALDDYTDQMIAATLDPGISAAAGIWALDDALGAPYTTGVYGLGITTSNGNVISQSWEFGGFGGDKSDLASRYVAALGGGSTAPQFRRGDTNIDGLLNIADAIYGLGALFPPVGSPPNVLQCVDSADANDDGSVNIADMITILGVLFPSGGGPTVLPPPFNVCGVDPTTADPNDCANYPTCP